MKWYQVFSLLCFHFSHFLNRMKVKQNEQKKKVLQVKNDVKLKAYHVSMNVILKLNSFVSSIIIIIVKGHSWATIDAK